VKTVNRNDIMREFPSGEFAEHVNGLFITRRWPCGESAPIRPAAYLRPEQLLCAECGEVFVYVDRPSRPTGGCDPRDVFAYEPPEYHGGKDGHVLFADGAVRWFTPAAQDELIDATLARQGAVTSQPE
jgi:prepilin-type processing-associated H-X9-DG protein